MTSKTTVTCDHCGADLSDAGAMPTFRLSLASEAIPNSGGMLYAVHVDPILRRPAHFCHERCLTRWLAGRGHVATLDTP